MFYVCSSLTVMYKEAINLVIINVLMDEVCFR